MRVMLPFMVAVFAAESCLAWSEGGHHLIAVLAFDELRPEQQAIILEILKSHPRYERDFAVPVNIANPEQWLIGRAACWPDLVRSQPKFDRSNWHFQPGSVRPNRDDDPVPDKPGLLPADATLETRELFLAQALELCLKIAFDKASPPTDRAIAVCWICHLIGDAHQPCHVGSLKGGVRFPTGDRGAYEIPTTVQSKNLYAVWDGMLGVRFDAADIRRRTLAIKADPELWTSAQNGAKEDGGLLPRTWLAESAQAARWYVYSPEVVEQFAFGSDVTKKPIRLSDQYLSTAREMAQRRAAFAAARLAAILAEIAQK